MWQVFKDHHELVCGLEDGDLTQDTISSAEPLIVCHLFNVPDHVHSTNEARIMLFSLVKKPEAISSTSDALTLHIIIAHGQSTVSKQANCS